MTANTEHRSDARVLCSRCEGSLTEVDFECGYCTNCGRSVEEKQKMQSQWQWANDTPVWLKPRRTLYFLVRRTKNGTEYRNDKRGRLITYRSREQAIRVQDRLNAKGVE